MAGGDPVGAAQTRAAVGRLCSGDAAWVAWSRRWRCWSESRLKGDRRRCGGVSRADEQRRCSTACGDGPAELEAWWTPWRRRVADGRDRRRRGAARCGDAEGVDVVAGKGTILIGIGGPAMFLAERRHCRGHRSSWLCPQPGRPSVVRAVARRAHQEAACIEAGLRWRRWTLLLREVGLAASSLVGEEGAAGISFGENGLAMGSLSSEDVGAPLVGGSVASLSSAAAAAQMWPPVLVAKWAIERRPGPRTSRWRILCSQ